MALVPFGGARGEYVGHLSRTAGVYPLGRACAESIQTHRFGHSFGSV